MADVMRDYQVEIRDQMKDSIRRGKRAPLVQSSTGTGKTVIFTELCNGAALKGNRSTILLPRRELVYQTEKKLLGHSIQAGIIMAGEEMDINRMVQLATFDTLHQRAMKRDKIKLPEAKMVIVDEAHLSVAETRKAIIKHYKDQKIYTPGFTATPARTDGKALGDIYDDLILGWPTAKMMDHGYLVRVGNYYAPSAPDLSKLHIGENGDYVVSELGHAMDKPKLIGHIVENWIKLASTRRTAVFCVTRAHGRHVTEAFVKAGVRAEYVDSETPALDRAAIFARLTTGQTQVLVNVFVATYGLDIPAIDCIVLARPTKSLVLYLQIIGRALRPVWPEIGIDYATSIERLLAISRSTKPDCIVIDHAGAVNEHGFVDDPVPWALDFGGKTISQVKLAAMQEKEAPKELTCPECATIFKGTVFCPKCGHQLLAAGKDVPTHKAMLVEVDQSKRANKGDSWQEKAEFMAQARGYAIRKGYNDGWVAHKYKEKYGAWPNDARVRNVVAKEPGMLLINFIKYLAIRRTKSPTRRQA